MLQQLAAVQVKPNELSMYSSVKSIGQREKRKLPFSLSASLQSQADADSSESRPRKVNSIAGANRKKLKTSQQDEEISESTDTDDISSDEEEMIDQFGLDKAVERFKKRVEEEEKKVSEQKSEVKKVEEKSPTAIGETNGTTNGSSTSTIPIVVNKRPTKYVHVERREEIQV